MPSLGSYDIIVVKVILGYDIIVVKSHSRLDAQPLKREVNDEDIERTLESSLVTPRPYSAFCLLGD
jgi:hypothetical protein